MKKSLAMMALGSVVTATVICYMGRGNAVQRTFKKMVRKNECILNAMKQKMGM